MSSTIYGISGISIDLINKQGGVNNTQTVRKFHEDLKILLETKRGTLIGDPDFGSNLCDLLFEPASIQTASMIRQEVATVIEKYYEQVIVDNIDIAYKSKTVQLSIAYRMFNTNIRDTAMLEFIRGDVS